ncbi:MAG: hypothetical protein A2Y05_04345 [Omnitrophica WOR_2 bacterium GWA2_53_43]|nr:MAG: hypothetical protein A2Y05_04345 [Omnitrophica WOR_2 bacterium GWA2_53_43]
MMLGFELTIIVVMLVLNAIFAAYEMALASISRSRIAFFVEEHKKGAQEASFMKDRMEASFAMIQLGITLVGALAAATGGAGVSEVFAPYLAATWGISKLASEIIALVVLIIPLTFVTIVFAELVPKMFALNNKERVVLALSPLMKFFALLFNPAISIIETTVKSTMRLMSKRFKVTESDEKRLRLHELKAAASHAKASRVLGVREERIILAAAQLSTRRVKEIIIPASDIFTIHLGNSLMDAFLKAHLDMHTRFPVCAVENDPQTIQGYVNFKDIVVALKMGSGEPGIKGVMRPILRMDEKMTISEAMERMIQEKTHIALVVAGQDRVLGMVTLEDIIEELVGEVDDEFDRSSFHIQPYGPSWLMGGGVPVTTAVARLGLDWAGYFKDKKIPTLQEWCVAKAGRPLTGGEVIQGDGVYVVPRKFRRKRLVEAIVSLAEHKNGAAKP